MTSTSKVRIVCISDTHNAAPGEGYTLPKGDILIHAGDLTNQGSLPEVRKAVAWLERADDFAARVVVAGNHDLSLDPDHSNSNDSEPCRELIRNNSKLTYLQHTSATVHLPDKHVSIRIFGSPYSPKPQPRHDPDRTSEPSNPGAHKPPRFTAFQYDRAAAAQTWAAIPADADVVITHAPPQGWCDASAHWGTDGGCEALREAVARVRPRVLVCGHCHEGRGAVVVDWRNGTAVEPRCRVWEDPGSGGKKMSLLDLTGPRQRRSKVLQGLNDDDPEAAQGQSQGRETSQMEGVGDGHDEGEVTAVVNASVMATSFGRGAKRFNKPIVIDLLMPMS